MRDDPLADLLLDAEEVDRARLATALRDLLGIDQTTGKVISKPGFNTLTTREKVLAFLVGKKAARLLDRCESEAVAPKDIIDETGMPKGTVNPKLRELLEDRLVSQTEGGEYYVESHQILRAIAELEKEES